MIMMIKHIIRRLLLKNKLQQRDFSQPITYYYHSLYNHHANVPDVFCRYCFWYDSEYKHGYCDYLEIPTLSTDCCSVYEEK